MYKTALILLLCSAALLAQESAPASSDASKSAAPAQQNGLPRIRTGFIAKIEFSAEKPAAASKSPVSQKSSSAWVVLTIQLDPGRAASIFDYVLRKDGTEYPCLDLADGEAPFTGKLRNYSSVDGKQCRLVFAVPSASDEYELVFKLKEESEAPVKLNAKSSSLFSLLK